MRAFNFVILLGGGVLAFLDMSVYKIGTKLEDRISELDDCESVFHATARDTRDYAKYRRLVQVMRVQLAVCKVQPRRKRSLSKWVSRTVTRAERIMQRRVTERDAWNYEGRGLLDDRFDFPLIYEDE